MLKKLCNLFQVGTDSVRTLYKRSLELDIEYKQLKIRKILLEVEKLEHEKKVFHPVTECFYSGFVTIKLKCICFLFLGKGEENETPRMKNKILKTSGEKLWYLCCVKGKTSGESCQ